MIYCYTCNYVISCASVPVNSVVYCYGDLKKMRPKHDRWAHFQIQLRQSIFIAIICDDVEVHENIQGASTYGNT